MGERNLVPLTVAIALGASLVSGVASYYSQQAVLNHRIAQVREDYVKKEDLREQVQKPLEEVRKTTEDLRREQAVQGQVLKDVKEILERRERRDGRGAGP